MGGEGEKIKRNVSMPDGVCARGGSKLCDGWLMSGREDEEAGLKTNAIR